MPKKKKKLNYPKKCNKCGTQPQIKKLGNWDMVRLNCPCGGRIETNFSKPYYE